MLFERQLREGIHQGLVVVAFRRWRRCQVVSGHRYRTGLDIIEVESVDIVRPADIDSQQASEAGYATVEDLLHDLRGDASLPLYRIRLRRVDEPDPRDQLAAAADMTADELTSLSARLARLDRSGRHGPWTMAVLTRIAERPATVSTVLADAMGWERQDFKQHVRKLKSLGLTISLDVGYRLSPRGEAYLQRICGDNGCVGAGRRGR
jgi:hypothetical protein